LLLRAAPPHPLMPAALVQRIADAATLVVGGQIGGKPARATDAIAFDTT
jgi:hypothetical protein